VTVGRAMGGEEKKISRKRKNKGSVRGNSSQMDYCGRKKLRRGAEWGKKREWGAREKERN